MIDAETTLIIKSGENEFENYYNEVIRQNGADVWVYEELAEQKVLNAGKAVWQYGCNMIRKRWRQRLKKYNLIILYDHYGLSIVPFLWICKKKEARMAVWENNVIFHDVRRSLKKLCTVYSFDKAEAQRFGWKWNPDYFYFKLMPDSSDSHASAVHKDRIKAFFAGAEKGRFRKIRQLQEELIRNGIMCDFWIPDITKEDAEKSGIHAKELPYREMIGHVQDADILIEILKEGQSGHTVRIMEAVFYGKKLVTNNSQIIKDPIYQTGNIMIWKGGG